MEDKSIMSSMKENMNMSDEQMETLKDRMSKLNEKERKEVSLRI